MSNSQKSSRKATSFFSRMLTALFLVIGYVFVSLLGGLWVYLQGDVNMNKPWHQLSRESAEMAPQPDETPEAVLQVYVARTYNWRGLFAVHPWIAFKDTNADRYTILEVIGWNLYRNNDVISAKTDLPDRYWYGNPPQKIFEARGEKAVALMADIRKLTENYPYRKTYKAYPGPNSNTYLAYLADRIPGFDPDIPPLAIGQRYPIENKIIHYNAESKTFTLSLWGHAGIVIGRDEGFRFMLFGVEWGFHPFRGFVVVPGIGKLGG